MKSSHLTRSVFRAILSNRPYIVHDCERTISRRIPRPSKQLAANSQQKRGLFGINFGTSRNGLQNARSTPENVELALGKLVDLVRARRSQSRSPPENEIVDAFRFLFSPTSDSPRPLTRNEVFLVTQGFLHLRERGHILGTDPKTSLTRQDLLNVLVALAIFTRRDTFRTDARALATYIFEALESRHVEDAPSKVDTEAWRTRGTLMQTYITVLSNTGSAQDGLKLLQKLPSRSEKSSLPMWLAVLKGLVNEGRMPDFWSSLQELQSALGELDAESQSQLVAHLANSNNISAMKRLLAHPLAGGQAPNVDALARALETALSSADWDWSKELMDKLPPDSDIGRLQGSRLVWHAIQDPSVENIRPRMAELVARGSSEATLMRTLNRLLEHAYTHQDAVHATQYIQLGESLGLHANGYTRALQLDHEVKNNNFAAASEMYELLTREDIPANRSDVPVLNRYLTALCFSPNADYNQIMVIVDHVLETNATIDAEAIAGLCHIFLIKDELEEATGLLRHRVESYPMNDRARIASVFRTFITTPTIKDQRAYNAYELFRHAFPETSVTDRIEIMQSFFGRKRSDLACLVFGHMRQSEDLPSRPTPEAYAKCFEGIASLKDIDGLQMVYNMLKLDLEVEQTTRIHNGLMAAYTECQQPFVSIIDHFWKILESREGPTLSSFILAFRACEKWIPQGSWEARQIMGLMQSFNLVITREIYQAYIGALAGQAEFENVVELIEEMSTDIGEDPDAVTIGTFYNAIPWQYRKDEVEKWAKKAYPELWAELETYGDTVDEEWEIRYFNIDRSVDMDDDLIFAEGEWAPILPDGVFDRLE